MLKDAKIVVVSKIDAGLGIVSLIVKVYKVKLLSAPHK
jgi:hypothetical protein